MLTQYGIPVITLSDLVDNFCLEQGNTKEVAIVKNTVHAKWAWKDLFRTTVWTIKQTVLEVCEKTHTITLPDDVERLVNITVIDRFNRQHPLGYNPNINTVQTTCQKSKCSCKNCHGQDSLCGAIDAIAVITNNVIIKGIDYTQTIYTRTDGQGNIQQVSNTPYFDEPSQLVKYVEDFKNICNVEIDSKGCIKPTPANYQTLQTHCGCAHSLNNFGNNEWWMSDMLKYAEPIPSNYNYYGQWNWNAAAGNIIHIYGAYGCNAHHNDERGIRRVIVAYQPNAETPGCEILVPEYALTAVEYGIMHRISGLSPRASAGDKETALNSYRREKRALNKFLNPIRMDDIYKLNTNQRYW